VVTDPIVLEGVALGRFRIDLNLDRFHYGRLDGDTVRAIALDPNPAASNDEITHPHVQGGQICLGEGSVMVRQALTEGRLYDALLVVRSVLMRAAVTTEQTDAARTTAEAAVRRFGETLQWALRVQWEMGPVRRHLHGGIGPGCGLRFSYRKRLRMPSLSAFAKLI
jgi:hypothetical protein